MIVIDETQNPIFQYYEKIKTREIVTSYKIKAVYKHLVKCLKDKKSKYRYDEKKANHALKFIQTYCKHSKGKWARKPLILELWQKAFICALFGIVDKKTGLRRFRKVFLLVARKNGKSILASAIALYGLMADKEAGAEIYAVATKRDQAKIIWGEAVKMVDKSPALKKRLKCLVSSIQFKQMESVFVPLGADSNTQDGLNPHIATIDELHAFKDKNLYDVVVDGMSAREQPIIFITSTCGTIREGIFDIEYDEASSVIDGYENSNGYKDDTYFPLIYELDKKEEWLKPECWVKANPNLGISKKIEYLENKAKRAQLDSRNLKNFLTKDCNVRETTGEAWLSFEEILNENTFDIAANVPNYVIGGADLSRTIDLTAACILFRLPGDETIYVKHMYWLPEDLLEKRAKEDNIPYELWHKQGYLRLCPGNTIRTDDVVDWFYEFYEEYEIYLSYCGYDSWSARNFVDNMKFKFGEEPMIPVIQGKKTLSLPMQQMGADLKAKRINYGNNPITRWCLMNTSIDVDKNGNIQPVKTSNPRRRIDGTAAMLDAYVAYLEKQDEYMGMVA
ncbi:MAG: terminase large subunit [Candidatus Gastranaerophilales bacterium]|nr:terminase large subunit [Candidatus Gastranaerophilales bacterium]